MLSFDDKRWEDLVGGYRIRFDARPLLLKLETNADVQSAWHQLWENLHHQGDVGEASYAAVPHIVRIYSKRGVPGWDTYAIVAVIDLARDNPKNPLVPDWLRGDYFGAIRTLAEQGVRDILKVSNLEVARVILSVLALASGARTHARFLLNYADEELLEMEKLASDHS